MKKLVSALLFIALLLSGIGCKNKLNVLAPYKQVPVVYGLLDQNDTVHYIRINRSYQTSGNTYTSAANYDSINYPVGTLTVQLQDNSSGTIITLGDTTGVALNAGIFSYPKQVLYYTRAILNPNDQYNLIITNKATNTTITGSTTLLPDVNVTIGGGSTGFLSNRAIDLTSPVQFPQTVNWLTNSQAMIYQLSMYFYFHEIDSVNKDTTTKFIDWEFASQSSSQPGAQGLPMSDQYNGLAFSQLVRSSLHQPPANVKRVPLYMQVTFTSGSSDLNTYLQLSQPSLDVNQQKPFFTDLKNAIGIFTSRHIQSAIRPLTALTVDSLENGVITRGLNFKPQ